VSDSKTVVIFVEVEGSLWPDDSNDISCGVLAVLSFAVSMNLSRFFLCSVSAISIRSGSLSKGFRIASQVLTIEFIHVVFRLAPRISRLSWVGGVYLKKTIIEG
jgi:hypothetical protein